MLERRSSERKQTFEESSSTIYWIYVLFYKASIAIDSDETIGKELSFVYFSTRLLEKAYLRNPSENGREPAAQI